MNKEQRIKKVLKELNSTEFKPLHFLVENEVKDMKTVLDSLSSKEKGYNQQIVQNLLQTYRFLLIYSAQQKPKTHREDFIQIKERISTFVTNQNVIQNPTAV
jgi:hypothetical protein